jgi:potassium efflux system protein
VVASDLRHRIDRVFRDAGICIAFPQRDVHLDVDKPLRIQLQAEQQPNNNQAGNRDAPAVPQNSPVEN